MIQMVERADGCVLAVRAQTGARKNGIVGEHGGALKVAVAAPPEDGKANKAVAEVLRQALGLKRSEVDLIGGQRSRDKQFLIRGRTKADLSALLAALLADQ
jgi:uncharacterized protein (TIGR00251 family)